MLESGQRVALCQQGKDGRVSGSVVLANESPHEANAKGRGGWMKGGGLESPLREIRPAFMTVPEVALRLHVSEKTVRRLVDRQKFPRCRHLGKVLIPFDAVEKWIVESTKH